MNPSKIIINMSGYFQYSLVYFLVLTLPQLTDAQHLKNGATPTPTHPISSCYTLDALSHLKLHRKGRFKDNAPRGHAEWLPGFHLMHVRRISGQCNLRPRGLAWREYFRAWYQHWNKINFPTSDPGSLPRKRSSSSSSRL